MAIARIYLFITDFGLSVWQGEPDRLAQTHHFGTEATELEAYAQWVSLQPPAHWYVLFDLQEEDYRIETIPHIGARDRRLVVGRRLQQLYRESDYRSATLQGRESEGRRDDRFLFAALTNPAPLDIWLRPLAAHDARLVAIYSIALLTARHAKQVDAIPARALIVSRQSGSGLRQTYLADGALRFSRLTAVAGLTSEELAASLAAEAARARQFLASLRAIDRTEALQVVMLCSETEQQALRASCPDTELIHYHFVGLARMARELGVRADVQASEAEPIWLRYIARKTPANQYATLQQRKPYLAWQLGRLLLVLAALLLLGGLLAGASWWQNSRELDQQAAALELRRQQAEQTYAANVPKANQGELTPTGMKNVVQSYRQLVAQWPELGNSLVDIAAVVSRYPMLQLDELAWQVSNDANAMPAGFSAGDKAAPPAGTATPTAVDANGNPLPAVGGQRFILIGIKGRLSGYERQHRQALALVEEISKALLQHPDSKVDKLELPIDIRPEGQIDLSNQAGEAIDGAPFSLKLTVPLAAPQPEAGS